MLRAAWWYAGRSRRIIWKRNTLPLAATKPGLRNQPSILGMPESLPSCRRGGRPGGGLAAAGGLSEGEIRWHPTGRAQAGRRMARSHTGPGAPLARPAQVNFGPPVNKEKHSVVPTAGNAIGARPIERSTLLCQQPEMQLVPGAAAGPAAPLARRAQVDKSTTG